MLFVDVHEAKSKIPELLKKHVSEDEIIVQALEIGDYVFGEGEETTVIERKATGDFLNSCFSGRLWDQASNMKHAYQKRIILVEGGFPVVYNMQTAKHMAAFIGALAKLYSSFNASIIVTPNNEASAQLIAKIYSATTTKDCESLAPVHKHTKNKATITENILCQIPQIGRKNAIALLSEFKTVQNVANASDDDIIRVIGKHRAELVIEYLKKQYKVK